MSYNSHGAKSIFLMETALSSRWRQATCCCHGAKSVPFNYHWPLGPKMKPCHTAAPFFHSSPVARTAASPPDMAAASASGLSSPSALIPHGFPALLPMQKCRFAARPVLYHISALKTTTRSCTIPVVNHQTAISCAPLKAVCSKQAAIKPSSHTRATSICVIPAM